MKKHFSRFLRSGKSCTGKREAGSPKVLPIARKKITIPHKNTTIGSFGKDPIVYDSGKWSEAGFPRTAFTIHPRRS